jgi:hypothetical protein
MSANKGKKNIPLIRNIIIAGIGVLAILGIAAIIFFFIRYREAVKLHSGASQSLVLIGQPANGSRILAGEPIQVQVNATGQSAFTSVELWINGVLEGVQEVPGEGRTSTTALFWWIPPGGGNYSLVGRAMDEKKWKASSPAVIVFATSMDNGEQPDSEGGKVNPAVLPAPPEEYSNPEPPSDDGAPADGWQASPGNWLNSLTTDSPPDAPELAVTAEGCNIKLDIHDQSENEEGFGVYRQTTNSQEWVHVTDLASHAGMGWIEYQDQDLSGGVTYYISAFNS